jgi:hypothetical protein
MTSMTKVCMDCGMALVMGVANCTHCGAQAGTLFEVTAVHTKPDDRNSVWKRIPQVMDEHQQIEKAQDRANSSVILGLSSFFPLFGLLLGIAAVVYAGRALKALKVFNIEEGKGSGMAGLLIGSLGIFAQACLILYAIRLISLGKI